MPNITPEQQKWLESVGEKAAIVLGKIEEGSYKAEYIIGRRPINGKAVHLKLVAEVADTSGNPLENHASGLGSMPGDERR